MESENLLAKIALPLWVPVVLYLFRTRPASKALAWSLVGGVLFLPQRVAYDFPVLPAFDKQSISTSWALIGCMLWHRSRLVGGRFYKGPALLLVTLALGQWGTALTNTDTVQQHSVTLAGMSSYDAVSGCISVFLVYAIPFFLGRTIVRSPKDLHFFMHAVATMGVIYSLLAAIEIRLSPQLHTWVYGFMQHDWRQVLRSGGYRPMVFMEHGLALAVFMVSATLCAVPLIRTKTRIFRVPMVWIVPWLALITLLCKSVAAIVYGLVTIPMLLLLSAKGSSRFAMIVAILSLTYPILRLGHALPPEEIGDVAEIFGEERAGSLMFRLLNEEDLLVRAEERLLFGWGGYGRSHIFDEEGRDTSTTDSAWIILLGNQGITGCLSTFGLLVWPVVRASRRLRSLRTSRVTSEVAALTVITAVNIADLLINGLFSYLPVLFAGCLLGVAENTDQAASAALSAHARAAAPVPRGADRSRGHSSRVPLKAK